MDWSHAVVVGAGIAGLLAASVLSEAFPRVTVYDRDALPSGPSSRQGVPQGRHAHGLHARGVAALEELLPGLRAEMLAAGGVAGDVQDNIHWYLDGYLAARRTAGLAGIGMTRRSLEWLIRSRVEKLPNVTITDSRSVEGLVVEGDRLAGVRVTGGAPVVADLVVDASGRGSRTPAWLAELGYPRPPQSRLRVDIIYVTRHYQHLPGQLSGIIGTAVVPYPGHRRGAALIRQEGGQWVLTLVGMHGEDPPTDDAGMLAYAQSLVGPEIASVMRDSPPLDTPVKMRFPASLRRHYAELGRIPSGLIVTGDALCSFNPVYAQGITVAALEALALREALHTAPPPARQALAGGGPASDVAERFVRAADRLVSAAWALSVGGDLRFPEAVGRRRSADRLVNAYLARLRAAASVDPAIGTAYLRVVNMVDPPAKLLAPGTIIRVVRAGGHARRARSGALWPY